MQPPMLDDGETHADRSPWTPELVHAVAELRRLHPQATLEATAVELAIQAAFARLVKPHR